MIFMWKKSRAEMPNLTTFTLAVHILVSKKKKKMYVKTPNTCLSIVYSIFLLQEDIKFTVYLFLL